jgi:hypothetical protein
MTYSESIALEHCRWARWEARMSPAEVLAAVNMPAHGLVTWDMAIDAVAHAYTVMQWRYRPAMAPA